MKCKIQKPILLKDTILKTLLASILASNGLINNSITSLIPSMLISPIGTILIELVVYLISTKKYKNQTSKMILKFIIIIITTISIGFIYGFIYVKKFKNKKLPSKEMKSRSNKDNLLESILIVLCCSISFSSAYINSDITTIISIGIATALLPPLVNIGLNYGVYKGNPDMYSDIKYLIQSKKIGMLLFLINSIGLFSGVYYYMKKQCDNI